MKKQITIKTSWEAVTLKEFEQLDQIMNADIPSDYKAVNILSVLSGEEPSLFENLPITTFATLIPKFDFLGDPIPESKVFDKYEINGHKYELHADIPSITTAQYMDYQNYMREKPVDLQKVISVFLLPEGHQYNDGYKIEEVLADINDMKIIDAQAIAFFIQRQSVLFIQTMMSSLSQKMKEMKIPRKQIEMDLTPLKDMGLHLTSYESVRLPIHPSKK